MDSLAKKLDERLRQWRPDTAAEARERILEVIELADQDLLDVARSRAAKQEVLDLLDEPRSRSASQTSVSPPRRVPLSLSPARIPTRGVFHQGYDHSGYRWTKAR